MDDGETFDYLNGHYFYRKLEFKENRLTSRVHPDQDQPLQNPLHPYNPTFSKAAEKYRAIKSSVKIERIVIVDIDHPNSVLLDNDKVLNFEYVKATRVLTIKKPMTLAVNEWDIVIT